MYSSTPSEIYEYVFVGQVGDFLSSSVTGEMREIWAPVARRPVTRMTTVDAMEARSTAVQHPEAGGGKNRSEEGAGRTARIRGTMSRKK